MSLLSKSLQRPQEKRKTEKQNKNNVVKSADAVVNS